MGAGVTATWAFDYDVLVVGSGFGGSVTALRLTEKGYRVGVLEAGPRFEDDDFAETSWDVKKYLFRPEVGCYGIQRIDALADCMIVSGAGVGGGSLVYANTLYEPLQPFFEDPQWSHITDWRAELAPFYDQAKRMLGVVDNPLRTPADDVMEKVASEMGVAETFHPTPVGVFFAGPDEEQGQEVADPYFGGAGPARNSCIGCGSCMSGCRHNAKNTLVKNYLYLAEQNGAKVMPLTTVTRVAPRDGGGYDVDVRYTKAKLPSRGARRTLTAEQVVFSASALGTQRLLHRMRDEGHLPRISSRLGQLSRTNSESILGAIAPDTEIDYSQGIAITSSFHPDADTHVEPCRYGPGSNFMSLMQTVLTDGDGPLPRWRTWLNEVWHQRSSAARPLRPAALVGADRHRPGDAEPGQLDHDLHQAGPGHPQAVHDLQAGPRRAEPDLDPGRQHRGAPDGQGDGRCRRRLDRRAVQPPADRALHRRLHDRGLVRDRRHRPVPADVRPPRPARGRRLGGDREPRGQPVADDHRPGRARRVAVAQQGRGRPAAGAGRGVRPARPGRAPVAGRAGTTRPGRCGCRSSGSPDGAPRSRSRPARPYVDQVGREGEAWTTGPPRSSGSGRG